MQPGGFRSRLELSVPAACTQPGRKPIRRVRMRARLWALGQIHAGIPQRALPAPSGPQAGCSSGALSIPEQQLILIRAPGAGGLHPRRRSCSLPAPLRDVLGAPQDPSPLMFGQKLGWLSPQEPWFAAVRRSRQLAPLKSSCLCVPREGEDHFHRLVR